MEFTGVYHRTSEQMSYPLNEDELIVNLKTGYDVERVFLHHGDPYEAGIMGGGEKWTGKREEKRTGNGIAIKAGARSAFMLRVRKGTPELSVRLENDMLRTERKEMGIPLKATVIKLRSEHDVRSACRLIDMAIEQRGREMEEARQRRRERRRRGAG